MGKFDKRDGSIYHVDAPDGHRYFVISDREFTRCSSPSEHQYVNSSCRCDACRDVHTERTRIRRERAAAIRRRQEEAQRPRRLLEEKVRDICREIRGDAG